MDKKDASKLPPDQVEKIKDILTLLDCAEKVNDMNFPGSTLHPLKGDLVDYWSVTVRANWRIIFRFEDGKSLSGRLFGLSLKGVCYA